MSYTALKFHALMCSTCSRYEKQGAFILKALKETHASQIVSDHDHAEPPDGLIERIIQKPGK